MCAEPSALSARPDLMQTSYLHPRQHKFTAPSACSDVAICSQAEAGLTAGCVDTMLALHWEAVAEGEAQQQASLQVNSSGRPRCWDLHHICIGRVLPLHQAL